MFKRRDLSTANARMVKSPPSLSFPMPLDLADLWAFRDGSSLFTRPRNARVIEIFWPYPYNAYFQEQPHQGFLTRGTSAGPNGMAVSARLRHGLPSISRIGARVETLREQLAGAGGSDRRTQLCFRRRAGFQVVLMTSALSKLRHISCCTSLPYCTCIRPVCMAALSQDRRARITQR